MKQRILSAAASLLLCIPGLGAAKPLKVEQSQPWFDAWQLWPDTYLIHEPGHPEKVASYLLLGEQRGLLFDSGLGIGDIGQLVGELTELPVAVLASHTHPDHVGGHASFDRVYGTDTAATRKAALGIDPEQARRTLRDDSLTRALPKGFDPASYHLPAFQITDTVEDGLVLDLGGRQLEVLLTPGHAEDALCLLDRERRLLLVGDTFYRGRVLVSDWPSFASSARRLATLANQVDFVLPAHSATLQKGRWLHRLGTAVEAIDNGTIDSQPFAVPWSEEPWIEHVLDGFSLLRSPPVPASRQELPLREP